MKNVALFALFLVGCGGADIDDSTFSSSGGEAGGGYGEAGHEEKSSSSAGTGGEDENVGGNSSSSVASSSTSGGCVPSVTCESIGAECGSLDTGCGIVECPNNCQGENFTCESFECVCHPKIAAEFPEEACGVVDDGCGGSLDLGMQCGDGTDPYYTCGGNGVPTEFNQSGNSPQENVCGGGCVAGNQFNENCVALQQPPRMWFCSEDNGPSPFEGCEQYLAPGEQWDNSWCCPMVQ